MIHENIELTGSLEISGSFIIPLGGDSDRESSPITGSLFYNTASRRLETYNGNTWVTQSAGSGGGGGGGVTFNGETEYLVVAGGGAGGFRTTSKPFYMGGGGAGGLLTGSLTLTSGSTYTVTVGAGGAAYAGSSTFGNGSSGGDSSVAGTGITTVTSTGGGYGSTIDHPVSDAAVSGQDGADGGSGGGATGWDSTASTGGSGTTGQGNDGGDGVAGANAAGAGGGGAGGSGTNNSGVAGRDAGDGGPGVQSDITGTNTYYAAGARGGRGYSGGNGAEGADGTGYRGVANSGDGGLPQDTTAGESGVIILAYDSSSAQGAGGISGDAGNARRYHQFNSSDSFVIGAVGDFDVVTDGLLVNVDAGDFSSRGTSTWSDLTGSNNGSVSGATLGANWYYDFDGSNDYISFSTFPNGADYKAFEIWINPDSYSNFAFQHGNGQSVENYLRFLSTDDIQLRMRNQTITVSGYSTNTWYHIVGQLDGSNFPNIWIDGTEVSTGTTAATATFSDETVNLGRRLNTGFSNVFWNGQIAQFRIYQNTLTDAQIAQNYNATKTNFV